MLAFDEKTAGDLESLYRSRDVVRRRRLVRDALGARPGERILDVGCGPGFYVAELLEEVGSEGSVVGLDRSPQMLAMAARRCRAFENVAFREAEATSLSVDDGSFDAALCVQVLEYVPDVPAALNEMRRALRTGGRLVLWDIDWTTLSWHSADPARMQRVLEAWDSHLAHPALPRILAPRLRAAGFDRILVEGHAFATTDLTPQSYGGAILPLIERFVAGRDEIGEAEARAWALEQRDLADRGEFFFSCTQFCFSARG
jgi:ubiquinone/menaquinone biosynthesis C-methylase UbiE